MYVYLYIYIYIYITLAPTGAESGGPLRRPPVRAPPTSTRGRVPWSGTPAEMGRRQ